MLLPYVLWTVQRLSGQKAGRWDPLFIPVSRFKSLELSIWGDLWDRDTPHQHLRVVPLENQSKAHEICFFFPVSTKSRMSIMIPMHYCVSSYSQSREERCTYTWQGKNMVEVGFLGVLGWSFHLPGGDYWWEPREARDLGDGRGWEVRGLHIYPSVAYGEVKPWYLGAKKKAEKTFSLSRKAEAYWFGVRMIT